MGFMDSVVDSFKIMGQLRRECRLYFVCAMLNGVSQGIFTVAFNLYILSLGLSTETLGGILSAGSLALALGSIPIGFVMELIGFKNAFLLVYGVSGLAKLLQVATPSVPLMVVASFVSGLVLSGDFVVRLPFLSANTTTEQRTHVFSLSSILFNISTAFGALLAGFAPTFFQALGLDLTHAYQLLLLIAGLLGLAGAIAIWQLKPTPPPVARHTISLAPYLWGINRFTVQQAAISLFVGLSLGLTNAFMNIYFLFHLGATREYFGVISALAIIPALLAIAVGPLLAHRTSTVRAVTLIRTVIPVFTINLALTTAAWSGTLSYWLMNALNSSAQPLSFAFAMQVARKDTQAATAAWLNVTFWMGMAIAAPLGGFFLGKADYHTPLFIAAASILAGGVLNEAFFKPLERPASPASPEEREYELKSS